MKKDQLVILDSTLREGLQSIYFDTIEKSQDTYIEQLYAIGIHHIEYRNIGQNPEAILWLFETQKKYPEVCVHIHMYLNERNVHNFVKLSEIRHISTFIPFPFRPEALKLFEKLALESSAKIRVSIENIHQISDAELEEILNETLRHKNVSRIGISDTTGSMSPKEIEAILKKLLCHNLIENRDIELHLHNDRGLAVANALQAIETIDGHSNRLFLSTSSQGIGERNGILSLEELIANILYLEIPHSYYFSKFHELQNILHNQGVHFDSNPLGKNSAIHIASSHLLEEIDSKRYSIVPPESIGAQRMIILNRNTTREAMNELCHYYLGRKYDDIFLDMAYAHIELQPGKYSTHDEVIDYIKKLNI